MNITYIAPFQTPEDIKQNEEIISLCKKYDHSCIEYYKISPNKKLPDRVPEIAEQIKKSEAVIAEVTTVTVETVRMISIAFQYHIPTLFIMTAPNPDTLIFEQNRFLTKKQYTQRTLETVLCDFFDKIDKQRLLYRFNLMLSQQLGDFIAEQAEKKKVSKADYLRNLIIQEMHK